jgi:hypothetical protein
MRVLVMTPATHTSALANPGSFARAQVLGATPQVFDTRVLGRDGKTLYLQNDCPIPPGSAVRIDVNGGMVLGEVGSSRAQDGGFVVAVAIDQIVPSVSELSRLVERVMAESRPAGVARDARAPR